MFKPDSILAIPHVRSIPVHCWKCHGNLRALLRQNGQDRRATGTPTRAGQSHVSYQLCTRLTLITHTAREGTPSAH